MRLKEWFSSLPEVTLNDINPTFPTYFTAFLKTFTDKTLNSMNDTGFLTYLGHVLMSSVTNSYRKWPIKNWFTQVGLVHTEENIDMVEDFLSN